MELEFTEEKLTVKEYLDEENEFLRARIMTFIKIMAKKAHVKINDIVTMEFADFQRNLKKFQKKYGIETGLDFLET